jgi:ABC-2 type transport system permease protein
MHKFWRFFKISVDEYLVYRLSFVLWRVRVFLGLLIIYFFWQAVFQNNQQVFGYNRAQILTYILLTQIVGGLVISGRTQEVANNIIDGSIINYLLKPFPFLKFVFIRETVDKLINFGFSLIEVGLLILLIKPGIVVAQDSMTYILFISSLFLGAAINFFLSLLISYLAFWTVETWASRFIFMMAVFALNGGYFPLDVLPKPIYQLLLATPFPYLLFG